MRGLFVQRAYAHLRRASHRRHPFVMPSGTVFVRAAVQLSLSVDAIAFALGWYVNWLARSQFVLSSICIAHASPIESVENNYRELHLVGAASVDPDVTLLCAKTFENGCEVFVMR